MYEYTQLEKLFMKTYSLPTGWLLVDTYSRGELETLSIGDYGKAHNIKADFLGFTKDINGVPNMECMPLSEKWVVTVSTQYGCPMRCTFCDVPNIKFNGNASTVDLYEQLINARNMYPDIKYTDRLNLHFARMGEPILNENVFTFAKNIIESKRDLQNTLGLRMEVLHPVLTTSLPKSCKKLKQRIHDWCDIKNNLYKGQAGLQFSINSTNMKQRSTMFNDMVLTLEELSSIAKELPPPLSRKYCLNFAYSTDFEIDAKYLLKLFNPNDFMVKITPIHNTTSCVENNIKTENGYTSYTPYKEVENDLINAGFDVLVFIPSLDEENGIVTCGNAILGGSELRV